MVMENKSPDFGCVVLLIGVVTALVAFGLGAHSGELWGAFGMGLSTLAIGFIGGGIFGYIEFSPSMRYRAASYVLGFVLLVVGLGMTYGPAGVKAGIGITVTSSIVTAPFLYSLWRSTRISFKNQ